MLNFDVKEYLKSPFKDLRKTVNLAICAMLIALAIAVSSLSTYFSIGNKISFVHIFIAIIAMKYGPLIAGFSGGMIDIIQFFIKPVGAFNPLLTLGAVFTGIIFGLFLYKDDLKLWKVITACLSKAVFVSILFNSFALSLIYENTFLAFVIMRIPEKLLFSPIEIFLIYFISKAFLKIKFRK